MLAGILFFLQRACSSLLVRLWKSISAAEMKQEIDLRLFGVGEEEGGIYWIDSDEKKEGYIYLSM